MNNLLVEFWEVVIFSNPADLQLCLDGELFFPQIVEDVKRSVLNRAGNLSMIRGFQNIQNVSFG